MIHWFNRSPTLDIPVPAPPPQDDHFTIFAALCEWRDARQAYKTEVEKGPATTNEGRRARLDLGGRWSKAEHELAKVAGRLGRASG